MSKIEHIFKSAMQDYSNNLNIIYPANGKDETYRLPLEQNLTFYFSKALSIEGYSAFHEIPIFKDKKLQSEKSESRQRLDMFAFSKAERHVILVESKRVWKNNQGSLDDNILRLHNMVKMQNKWPTMLDMDYPETYKPSHITGVLLVQTDCVKFKDSWLDSEAGYLRTKHPNIRFRTGYHLLLRDRSKWSLYGLFAEILSCDL